MTGVPLDRLCRALLAQVDELSVPALNRQPGAVAQQVLHQARTGELDDALALAAATRLHQVATEHRGTALITQWSTAGQRDRLRPYAGPVHLLRLTDQGRIAVFVTSPHTGDGHWTLWRWELPEPTGRDVRVLPRRPRHVGFLDRPVVDLDVTADGRLAVTGDQAGEVTAWTLRDGARHVVGRHDSPVRAVGVSHDGDLAVSAGSDGAVSVWPLAVDTAGPGPGRPVDTAGVNVRDLAVAGDTGTFVVGGNRGQLVVCSFTGAAVPRSLPEHSAGPITVVADALRVLSIAADNSILSSPLDGGRATQVSAGHPVPLRAVTALAGDVLAGDAFGRVLRWAGDGGPATVLGVHDRAVNSLAASGGCAVSGGKDGLLLRWGPQSSAEAARQQPKVWTLSADPDGETILIGNEYGLHRWRPADVHGTATRLTVGPVFQSAVVADDLVAVAAPDGSLQLLDRATGVCLTSLSHTGSPLVTAIVTVDGRRFLTTRADGAVTLWSNRDGDWTATVLGRHARTSKRIAAAVCPDGRFAITGGDDGRLLRWDLGSAPHEPHAVGAPDARIRHLLISPDGGTVFSGDERGRLLAWSATPPTLGVPDIPERDLVLRNLAHYTGPRPLGAHDSTTKIQEMVLGGDGRWLASIGDDGAVCLWSTRPASTRRAGADAAAPRPLSRLITASIPLRMITWQDGLLLGHRNGGLTALTVAPT